MPNTNSYSTAHRVFEVVGIVTFFVFACGVGARVFARLGVPGAGWIVFAGLLSGYIVADFFSGLIHWLADRYGTQQTPFFGPHFVTPFREHHVFPKKITTHDFIETNGNNCIVSFWILAVAYFVPVRAPSINCINSSKRYSASCGPAEASG